MVLDNFKLRRILAEHMTGLTYRITLELAPENPEGIVDMHGNLTVGSHDLTWNLLASPLQNKLYRRSVVINFDTINLGGDPDFMLQIKAINGSVSQYKGGIILKDTKFPTVPPTNESPAGNLIPERLDIRRINQEVLIEIKLRNDLSDNNPVVYKSTGLQHWEEIFPGNLKAIFLKVEADPSNGHSPFSIHKPTGYLGIPISILVSDVTNIYHNQVYQKEASFILNV